MNQSILTLKAQAIRKELKSNFPGTKFSVRSKSGIDGAIRIRWSDLPSIEAVELVTSKYREVQFDKVVGDILGGGNDFIFTEQEISEGLRERINLALPEDLDYMQKFHWERKVLNEIYQEVREEKLI